MLLTDLLIHSSHDVICARDINNELRGLHTSININIQMALQHLNFHYSLVHELEPWNFLHKDLYPEGDWLYKIQIPANLLIDSFIMSTCLTKIML